MAFTRDLVSYYGAPTDGRHHLVAITTLVSGDPTLITATPIFNNPGDVGRIIQIRGAGGGGFNDYVTRIRSVTSTSEVELFSFPLGDPTWTVSGTTKDIWIATNSNDALVNFRNDARAEALGAGGLCTLTVPAGIYCWGCNDGGSGGFPFDENHELYWMAAPLIRVVGTGNPTFFGQIGFGMWHAFPGEPGYVEVEAKIANANIGDTTITLLNPADSAKFVVGRTQTYHTGDPYEFNGRLFISGYETQGYGSPPNPRFFEWVMMSSINAGTGVITLATPLTDGPYLSTYPDWSGDFLMGAARVYAFDRYWDSDQTIEGVTLQMPSTGTGMGARSITYKNLIVGGDNFPNASVAGTVTVDNVQFPFTEADKIVHTFNIQNGCTGETSYQSSSIKYVNITNCGTGIFRVNGTPLNLTITDSDIANLTVGSAYGQMLSLTATNAGLGTTSFAVVGSLSHTPDWTITPPGLITHAGIVGGLSWGFPGSKMIWQRTYNYQGNFDVLAVTQPGGLHTDQVIQTDIAFTDIDPPPIDDPGSGAYIMMGHPCHRTFLTDCTSSSEDVANACKPGGYGKPFYSYALYDYTEASGSILAFMMWGKVVFIKFNVITPYTGPNNGKVHILSTGGNYPMYNDAGTKFFWDPVIDTKTAGLRIITPAGVTNSVTGTGGLGSDANLTMPDSGLMFSNPIALGAEGGGLPGSTFHFTLEITSDQETITEEAPVTVIPLRLGFHA